MKRLIAFSAAIVLLAAMLAVSASAIDVDLERKCSITATMTYNGDPVPGGTMTLYRVASLHPDDRDLFHYVQDFQDCGVSLAELDFDTAVELATFVYHNELEGLTQKIGKDGVVRFEDLEVGLYLLIQWEAAEGFYELTPYLISIPNNEDGVYVYDTESAPKQTPDQRPTEPPTEEPPTEEPPTEPSTEKPTVPPTVPPTSPPTEPPEKLPQTGMTNWPVPILAVCGVFFVAVGLVMVIKGKEDRNEG